MKPLLAQKGSIGVEFAMVGVIFLLFLLVVIDMGRWMMTMGLLQEGSHRVAKAGAVSNPQITDIDTIKRKGLFVTRPDDHDQSATIPGLTVDHFSLNWLDGKGEPLPENPPSLDDIEFVSSSINDYEFIAFSPIHWFGILSVPDFQVTVHRESLGRESVGKQSQPFHYRDSNQIRTPEVL